MDSSNQSQQEDVKKGDLAKLHAEYVAAQELVKENQRKLETVRPQYEKLDSYIFDLAEYRDSLNTAIRKQRKEKEDTEAHLAYVSSQLTKYENAVMEARKNVDKARRDARPVFKLWILAQSELSKAIEKLNIAKQEYVQAGGKLTSEEKAVIKGLPQAIKADEQSNPWASGTFYLFAFIILVSAIVYLIYLSFPWYSIVAVFIVASLTLLIIAALQLRNDENLSEENFIKLILEVIKQFFVLRKP